MTFLKWYSIIFCIITILVSIITILATDNKEERIITFISLLLEIPILIYVAK